MDFEALLYGLFIDLGGNIGCASLFALSVGAKRTVAYEAATDTFAVLQATFARLR